MKISPTQTILCFQWPGDCDAVIAQANEGEWMPGLVQRSEAAGPESAIRSCAVSTSIDRTLLAQLSMAVTGFGNLQFGFEVHGMKDNDPTYVMRYATGDHFTWHVDDGLAEPPLGTRKLSFSLQLSDPNDYDGGDLEFATYSPLVDPDAPPPSQVFRQRGALVVFPSFMLHRISPITRGTRYAMVGWVHGPPFR